VLRGTFAYPSSPSADELRPLFRRRFDTGASRLAVCAGDVLVTHAGISTEYIADWQACGHDPRALATRLETDFRNCVK
jgi:hypothetical protein